MLLCDDRVHLLTSTVKLLSAALEYVSPQHSMHSACCYGLMLP